MDFNKDADEMTEELTAMCRFCGQDVVWSEAVKLSIQSPSDEEATQGLCAHRTCLRSHVSSDVPLITELSDE